MKKKSFIIVVIVVAVLVGTFHFNVGQVADRAIKAFIMSSTTWSKTIEVIEMTVDGIEENVVSLKDENNNIFDIIDSRFHEGDIVEVGIDTMLTSIPEDDVVVWTIKK